MRELSSGYKHQGTGRYGRHFVHTLSASAHDQNILSSLLSSAQGEDFTISPWAQQAYVPLTLQYPCQEYRIQLRLDSVRTSSAPLPNLCELENVYLIFPSFSFSSVKYTVGRPENCGRSLRKASVMRELWP